MKDSHIIFAIYPTDTDSEILSLRRLSCQREFLRVCLSIVDIIFGAHFFYVQSMCICICVRKNEKKFEMMKKKWNEKKNEKKKNEKKRKISTCVYVHSILHHWRCILMFVGHFIEYVYWWELACELSETLHYLYSCFVYFESEMNDISLRRFVSLSFPSLYSLIMWLHFMLDSSGSSLIFVFFASLYLLLIHPLRFTPWHFLTMTHFRVCYSLRIIITHLIISLIFFFASLLLSFSHWAPSSPWLMGFFVHVAFHTWGHGFFIIGYLGLVSLHFYYLITLTYVTSRVLRPP